MLTKFSPLSSGSDLGSNEPWPKDDSDEEIETAQITRSTNRRKAFIEVILY